MKQKLIDQLIHKAGARFGGDGINYDGFAPSKFAESIVRECVSILRKPEYPMTHPEELTDYNRGWVNGRLLGIEHIAYRFGVEE